MKRLLTPFALLAVLMVGAPSAAFADTDDYSAPKMYDADALACNSRDRGNNMVDVNWDNPRSGTGFTVLKYSTSSSFSDPKYVHSDDLHKYPSSAKGDEIFRVDNLKAKKKYYFKVAVGTFEGERLSPYSKADSATTKSC